MLSGKAPSELYPISLTPLHPTYHTSDLDQWLKSTHANSAECCKDGRAHKTQMGQKNRLRIILSKSELPSRTINPTWKSYFHNLQCDLQQTHRGLEGMIKASCVFSWTSDWVSCCWSIATAKRPNRFSKGLFFFFPSLQKNRYCLHTIWHLK